MRYIADIDKFKLVNMTEEDYTSVKAFLDEERAKLKRIEFFYPYKDEELRQVLKNGLFMSLTKGEEIIGTIALDFDSEYAKFLASIIRESTKDNVQIEKAYEVSGYFVKQGYRGKGIGRYLIHEAIEELEKRNIVGCSVVHLENIASVKSFFNEGYKLLGVKKIDENYSFGYFVFFKPLKNIAYRQEFKVADFLDIDMHLNLLQKGYIGIGISEKGYKYAKEQTSV